MPNERKRLGQFFTGIPLGKLLASLSIEGDTTSVLDPMAGNGDLLEASLAIARRRGRDLDVIAGVEIDAGTASACSERMHTLVGGVGPDLRIVRHDAFAHGTAEKVGQRSFDLVITNPPFVRYQSVEGGEVFREKLAATIAANVDEAEAEAWVHLAKGYSGLADLSVPAILLAASFVRPNGRLALVLPSTWRSRDYANTIRYLLLRFFELECVVDDEAPGWFSDALVRTNLLVARRLSAMDATRLSTRKRWPSATRVRIDRCAASGKSIVGAAFSGDAPEEEFCAWVRGDVADELRGLHRRPFSTQDEWQEVRERASSRRWFAALEGEPKKQAAPAMGGPAPPEIIRDLLADLPSAPLQSLNDAGIEVGQGLRTGCNRFFYVTRVGMRKRGSELVETSSLFGSAVIEVPSGCLKPVVRRQSEIEWVARGEAPPGRVLDLRGWILPEDREALAPELKAETRSLESMSGDLAQYVREAGTLVIEDGGRRKRIPELSAVAPNIRRGAPGKSGPRFWYMLPDFAARHAPSAFVPRVNDGLPWVEANADPSLIIDANFSTIWSPDGSWTRHALKALLNSAWCRAAMEGLGTPLGGGALKLEATHLRRMPIPRLSRSARDELDRVGQILLQDTQLAQAEADRIVLGAICVSPIEAEPASVIAANIKERAERLSMIRRRAA